MCNNNRIQLKKSDTNQYTGFIIESNDSTALACIGWAIEKHLDDIPFTLKPSFQKILEDTRIKKRKFRKIIIYIRLSCQKLDQSATDDAYTIIAFILHLIMYLWNMMDICQLT